MYFWLYFLCLLVLTLCLAFFCCLLAFLCHLLSLSRLFWLYSLYFWARSVIGLIPFYFNRTFLFISAFSNKLCEIHYTALERCIFRVEISWSNWYTIYRTEHWSGQADRPHTHSLQNRTTVLQHKSNAIDINSAWSSVFILIQMNRCSEYSGHTRIVHRAQSSSSTTNPQRCKDV